LDLPAQIPIGSERSGILDLPAQIPIGSERSGILDILDSAASTHSGPRWSGPRAAPDGIARGAGRGARQGFLDLSRSRFPFKTWHVPWLAPRHKAYNPYLLLRRNRQVPVG
jgi:hypothetical protein